MQECLVSTQARHLEGETAAVAAAAATVQTATPAAAARQHTRTVARVPSLQPALVCRLLLGHGVLGWIRTLRRRAVLGHLLLVTPAAVRLPIHGRRCHGILLLGVHSEGHRGDLGRTAIATSLAEAASASASAAPAIASPRTSIRSLVDTDGPPVESKSGDKRITSSGISNGPDGSAVRSILTRCCSWKRWPSGRLHRWCTAQSRSPGCGQCRGP